VHADSGVFLTQARSAVKEYIPTTDQVSSWKVSEKNSADFRLVPRGRRLLDVHGWIAFHADSRADSGVNLEGPPFSKAYV
jgi:hypothetical protein